MAATLTVDDEGVVYGDSGALFRYDHDGSLMSLEPAPSGSAQPPSERFPSLLGPAGRLVLSPSRVELFDDQGLLRCAVDGLRETPRARAAQGSRWLVVQGSSWETLVIDVASCRVANGGRSPPLDLAVLQGDRLYLADRGELTAVSLPDLEVVWTRSLGPRRVTLERSEGGPRIRLGDWLLDAVTGRWTLQPPAPRPAWEPPAPVYARRVRGTYGRYAARHTLAGVAIWDQQTVRDVGEPLSVFPPTEGAVSDDGAFAVFYVDSGPIDPGEGHARLEGFSVASGERLWSILLAPGPRPGEIAVEQGIVMLTLKDSVQLLDVSTGALLWTLRGMAVSEGSSFLAGVAIEAGTERIELSPQRQEAVRLPSWPAQRAVPTPPLGLPVHDPLAALESVAWFERRKLTCDKQALLELGLDGQPLVQQAVSLTLEGWCERLPAATERLTPKPSAVSWRPGAEQVTFAAPELVPLELGPLLSGLDQGVLVDPKDGPPIALPLQADRPTAVLTVVSGQGVWDIPQQVDLLLLAGPSAAAHDAAYSMAGLRSHTRRVDWLFEDAAEARERLGLAGVGGLLISGDGRELARGSLDEIREAASRLGLEGAQPRAQAVQPLQGWKYTLPEPIVEHAFLPSGVVVRTKREVARIDSGGQLVWHRPIAAQSLTVADAQTLLVGEDGALLALSLADGTEQERFEGVAGISGASPELALVHRAKAMQSEILRLATGERIPLRGGGTSPRWEEGAIHASVGGLDCTFSPEGSPLGCVPDAHPERVTVRGLTLEIEEGTLYARRPDGRIAWTLAFVARFAREPGGALAEGSQVAVHMGNDRGPIALLGKKGTIERLMAPSLSRSPDGGWWDIEGQSIVRVTP